MQEKKILSLKQLVSADVWRCRGADSVRDFFTAWFQDPAFRPVLTLRLVQACRDNHSIFWRLWCPIAKLWHRRTQMRCGCDIPSRLHVGTGFKLLHGWGIVINSDTSIGANVTIMQGVTIGGTGSGIPVIEDDVIVCANATVIGNVRLGMGAIVGAGCVVTKDVAPHTTVVGNPQRVIVRRQAPKGYNPLPDTLR